MLESCATVAGKLAFLKGEVKAGHVFKLALYTKAADLGNSTKKYTPKGEVSGQNYKVQTLPSPTYSEVEKSAYFGFSGEVKWQNATITADGCLIYDESLDNLALFVVAFPSPITSTNHEFVVTLNERLYQI